MGKFTCLVVGVFIGILVAFFIAKRQRQEYYHRAEVSWILYLVESAERERRAKRNILIGFGLLK